MSDSAVKTGQCLCGAVKYEVRNLGSEAVACHCGQCRRQSGHYIAAASVTGTDVTVTEDCGLDWYSASDAARRGFCTECGAILFWESRSSNQFTVFIGSLDSPTGLTLVGHIFVEDKGDYYDIDDGLPQFEGYDRPVESEVGSGGSS